MGLSSPGIGSGLDIAGIVSSLMNAERVPLNILKARETSYNAKVSSYGTLKSTISTFQESLKALSATALAAQKATSANEAVLKVTGSSGSTSGTYDIKVTQLAREHKLASAGSADSSALLGAGTMSIQVGTAAAVDIPAGDYSLKGLSDAINAANAGVSATIINDGTTNKLVVSARTGGVANTVSISASGGLAAFDSTGGTMSSLQTPLDAKLDINGIPVTKNSNTITDAVSGLTLDLVKVDAAPVRVTVANDTESVKKAITGFVDAYNVLSTKIKDLTSYDAATKKSGALAGDPAAASMLRAFRTEMGGSTAGGTLATLSDLGINFDRSGKLSITEDKLKSALDTKFTEVARVFSAPDGFATRLDAVATRLLDSTGMIATRTEGFKNTLKTISDSQAAMELRLQATEKRIRAQFSALDGALSSMQQTSSYLSAQLASLSSSGE